MAKKLTRTLAGVMSLMFVGQIMVFGDGAVLKVILHADTIASAAEAIEGMQRMLISLAEEFEEATKGSWRGRLL